MAAFANRAALLAYCAAEAHRTDLTSDMPVFCALAEADINVALKQLRPQINRWTATIESEFEALPSDFGGVRSMRLTTGTKRRVAFVTPDVMQSLKGANPDLTGEPQYFTVLGDSFEFFPDPDSSEYGITFTGPRTLPALTDDSSTNWLLAAHPGVYVSAIMVHVANRTQDWDLKSQHQIDRDRGLALIDRASLHESYAEDLTPTTGLVV